MEKLSPKEALIVGMLIKRARTMYGLEFVAESKGEIVRGTVYVLLDRMEDRGLVKSRQEAKSPGVPGIPRRLYEPTGSGVKAYESWLKRRAVAIGIPVPTLG